MENNTFGMHFICRTYADVIDLTVDNSDHYSSGSEIDDLPAVPISMCPQVVKYVLRYVSVTVCILSNCTVCIVT